MAKTVTPTEIVRRLIRKTYNLYRQRGRTTKDERARNERLFITISVLVNKLQDVGVIPSHMSESDLQKILKKI